MVWDNLGKLSLSPDWQRFDISVLDDSLLRIKQVFNEKPLGYAQLASVFADGSRGLFRRVYPYKDEPRLLLVEADPEFRAAGFNFRFLEVKIHPRTRFYGLGWTMEIEIWSDDIQANGGEIESNSSGADLDGGTFE